MIYRPNKKETKQIKEVNKGYKLMRKGFETIIKNSPKQDVELSVYIYRAGKNIDNIIKRVAALLEARYIDREFFNIVDKSIKNPKKPKGK